MKRIVLILIILTFALVSSVLAKVNLNTADKKELMELKGIGEKKAEAIIKYRESKRFKSVDEILKVKGIGEKILEQNRDNLCVGEDCKE